MNHLLILAKGLLSAYLFSFTSYPNLMGLRLALYMFGRIVLLIKSPISILESQALRTIHSQLLSLLLLKLFFPLIIVPISIARGYKVWSVWDWVLL